MTGRGIPFLLFVAKLVYLVFTQQSLARRRVLQEIQLCYVGKFYVKTDDHTACSNWDSSTTSTVRGTIDTNIDIISWQWDVADEKSVGWFHPFCNTVSFELITMNVRNITERESCTIVQDNNYASGDITQTCNCGLDDGDLLSWRVDTNYESNSSEDTSGNDDWRGLHRVA